LPPLEVIEVMPGMPR